MNTQDTFKHKDLSFRTGPFNVRLNSKDQLLNQLLDQLYPHIPLLNTKNDTPLYHYQINIEHPNGLRRYLRPQVELIIDQIKPFEPYPKNHSLPLFEWGLNWVIAMTAHQYLMLHSAVLERNDIGCIFPAMPGSGKSTLCAALAYNGWRLLSDEFGIFDHSSKHLLPMPRAIGLKNESIPIIREYLPDAVMGPSFFKTRKGTVAHVAPPELSLNNQHIPVQPKLIVFPLFSPQQKCRLKTVSKSVAFTKLSNNSFNYKVSMQKGFHSLSHLIAECDTYTLEYHSFETAIDTLKDLFDEKSSQ